MSLVMKYQDTWPEDFDRIRQYLESGIESYEVIEHVGSTSIPGMVAKPVIDIIISVPAGKMNDLIEELAGLEYRHQGDFGGGREGFDYLPPHIPLATHHLYACYFDCQVFSDFMTFREFMRKHPEWRKRLSALKLELDKKYKAGRKKYMDGKSYMYEEIMRLAHREWV